MSYTSKHAAPTTRKSCMRRDMVTTSTGILLFTRTYIPLKTKTATKNRAAGMQEESVHAHRQGPSHASTTAHNNGTCEQHAGTKRLETHGEHAGCRWLIPNVVRGAAKVEAGVVVHQGAVGHQGELGDRVATQLRQTQRGRQKVGLNRAGKQEANTSRLNTRASVCATTAHLCGRVELEAPVHVASITATPRAVRRGGYHSRDTQSTCKKWFTVTKQCVA